MPDLRIIQQKQEAAAYLAAQDQAYARHEFDPTINKILDKLEKIESILKKVDEDFARVNNIHIPSTWENIVNFFRRVLRYMGIIS